MIQLGGRVNYNIFIELGLPKKLLRLIKLCLNETYSKVRVDRTLVDMFLIKNGLKKADALLSLLFHFALEYVIKKVQVNQDALKLSGTHQLLGYTDDFNILDGNVLLLREMQKL